MLGFIKRHRSPVWTMIILSVIGLGTFVLAVEFTLCGGPRARESVQRNACINNLRQIDGAKEQWALAHKKQKGEVIVPSEIDAYLKHGRPQCPANGVYRYGKLGDAPTCTFERHTLE